MTNWYYSKGGQQLGPVTAEQMNQMVAQGVISAGDLVWQEGMAQWQPASTVFAGAQPTQASMYYAGPMVEQSGGAQKTLAILGIVFGCIGLIFCPLFIGGAGIVCSAIAFNKPGPNKKLAKIALIISIVGTIVGIVLGVLVFSAMRR